MSQRIDRINQLIQREVSFQLHKKFQNRSVMVTITSVDTSSDLRNARIYYSVLGDSTNIESARRLFVKIGRELQNLVSKVIVLKYFPKFDFIYDESFKRGASLIELMDDMLKKS